jgi:UTP-glucose-1-phosphate uridylyltransferase/mevalonate kinase
MKIFVPGRLCLFGEHSDWAGDYRRLNPELEKGYTLLVGTNQGLYAEVKPHPTQLILHASLSDGTRKEALVLPMERQTLLAEAEKGGFFSYAAGVAYQFLTHYQVCGLEIDNYLTDLPIQKGLASSAALCVLVARAFNRLYDLKMTIRGEMEFAYLGEITTPSRCGRMDQACAYGNRPIMMVFDGDSPNGDSFASRTEVIELKVPKDLFFVIVDLGAGKNTQEILSQLNQSYPFATNEIQQNVQNYLGSISSQITQEAVDALQKGDAEQLGALMKRAQAEFDKHLIPACPSQLTAPILHQILNYEPIQPYILGGKGVGSQGDGTAQFIVKDDESQQKVIEIIERDFPQMQSLKLTIQAQNKVRKAVIPAAGFGTRLFPATKVVKKELFPIIDQDGRAKPIILAIVEEAITGGIEEVGIVVQKSDRALFEDFFKAPPSKELFNKLSPQNQEYSQYLQDLGSRITILTQEEQEGYGHAVFCAKKWVKDEPFLLLLGDHVYASENETSCASQVLDVYEQVGQSVVGLTVMPAEIIHKAGCVTGIWQESDSILSVTQLSEKPDIDYARSHLHMEGMAEDQFLGIFGMYVLEPKIFDFLEEHINQNIREKGEFQLTSCLDRLRQEEGITGYLVKGRYFDTGMPEFYRQTMIDFRNAGQ